MFLIIAIGLTIGIIYLINNLHDKYTMLKQKVFTSTANILTDVEVHTNFEIIPSIHNWGDSLGYVYGIKNKVIYYKKNDDIIRTKDATYDMAKVGYELCSFRPTPTGWILLYRQATTPRTVLFSITDDSFEEISSYGPWEYNMFFKGSIYSYQHPYVWISPNSLSLTSLPNSTQYETVKMNITNGNYSPSEIPNFDCNYSFSSTIFQVDNRKILIEDFINYLKKPILKPDKIINNYLIFYDGTYIYYVPNSIWKSLPYPDYPAVRTFYPWKAVKINE